jgi:hypothetical protein
MIRQLGKPMRFCSFSAAETWWIHLSKILVLGRSILFSTVVLVGILVSSESNIVARDIGLWVQGLWIERQLDEH